MNHAPTTRPRTVFPSNQTYQYSTPYFFMTSTTSQELDICAVESAVSPA